MLVARRVAQTRQDADQLFCHNSSTHSHAVAFRESHRDSSLAFQTRLYDPRLNVQRPFAVSGHKYCLLTY